MMPLKASSETQLLYFQDCFITLSFCNRSARRHLHFNNSLRASSSTVKNNKTNDSPGFKRNLKNQHVFPNASSLHSGRMEAPLTLAPASPWNRYPLKPPRDALGGVWVDPDFTETSK